MGENLPADVGAGNHLRHLALLALLAVYACTRAWEWDGGDDSDSAYVPDPFFRERTLCWRHGSLLAPEDTMPLGR